MARLVVITPKIGDALGTELKELCGAELASECAADAWLIDSYANLKSIATKRGPAPLCEAIHVGDDEGEGVFELAIPQSWSACFVAAKTGRLWAHQETLHPCPERHF